MTPAPNIKAALRCRARLLFLASGKSDRIVGSGWVSRASSEIRNLTPTPSRAGRGTGWWRVSRWVARPPLAIVGKLAPIVVRNAMEPEVAALFKSSAVWTGRGRAQLGCRNSSRRQCRARDAGGYLPRCSRRVRKQDPDRSCDLCDRPSGRRPAIRCRPGLIFNRWRRRGSMRKVWTRR